MKILMVNGTMRKSSTYQFGKMLIDKVKRAEDSVTELFLPKDMPEFCVGCGQCFMKGEENCPHYDYTKRITALVDEADLLVFTSPVFVFHSSGQMKALLDHYGYRWMVHRPEKSMFTKQAVCLSTAAGGGMKSTNKDIADSFRFWGIGRIYRGGLGVHSTSWGGVPEKKKQKMEQITDDISRKINRRRGNVTPDLYTKIMFSVMKMIQKKGGLLEKDKQHWKENGWLDGKKPWKTL